MESEPSEAPKVGDLARSPFNNSYLDGWQEMSSETFYKSYVDGKYVEVAEVEYPSYNIIKWGKSGLIDFSN